MPILPANFAARFATLNPLLSRAGTPALAQTRCPVCAESACQFIAAKDREGKPMTTVACTRCGLLRVDPLPATGQIEQFHEQEYRNSYKCVRRPKLKHIYRAGMLAAGRLRHLSHYLGQNSTVLDIGCASGEWRYLLGTKGHSAL